MDNKESKVMTGQAETGGATENQPEQIVAKEKKSNLGLKTGIGVIAAAFVVGGVSFFAMGGTGQNRLADIQMEYADSVGQESEKADTGSDNVSQNLESGTAEETEGAEQSEDMDQGDDVRVEEAAAAIRVSYVEEMAAIADASVGDIVYFGSYEQDNDFENATEPVEWYVLDKADGEATLLSVYLLDYQPYHETFDKITWENCTLRGWLNSEFYNTAFSTEEQLAIINTNVVNEDNPSWGTEGGNNTIDKVWLLSRGEAERYFHIDPDVSWGEHMSYAEYAVYCYGQDPRICAKSTAYAEAEGLYTDPGGDAYGIDMSYAVGSGKWWLRSPGNWGGCAQQVHSNGAGLCDSGVGVGGYGGVRPALKVAY